MFLAERTCIQRHSKLNAQSGLVKISRRRHPDQSAIRRLRSELTNLIQNYYLHYDTDSIWIKENEKFSPTLLSWSPPNWFGYKSNISQQSGLQKTILPTVGKFLSSWLMDSVLFIESLKCFTDKFNCIISWRPTRSITRRLATARACPPWPHCCSCICPMRRRHSGPYRNWCPTTSTRCTASSSRTFPSSYATPTNTTSSYALFCRRYIKNLLVFLLPQDLFPFES